MSLYAILRRVSRALAVGITPAIAILAITLGDLAAACHAAANPAYPPTLPSCAMSVSQQTLSGADEAAVPKRARQLVAASPTAACPTNTPPHSTPGSSTPTTPDSSSTTQPPPPSRSTSSALASRTRAGAGQVPIGITLAVAGALLVLGGLSVLLLTRRSGWRSE
jgi:hypothetical protein